MYVVNLQIRVRVITWIAKDFVAGFKGAPYLSLAQ